MSPEFFCCFVGNSFPLLILKQTTQIGGCQDKKQAKQFEIQAVPWLSVFLLKAGSLLESSAKLVRTQNVRDQISLQENWRYQGNISCKDGHIKDRNSKDLIEAEEIKRWQEYIQELYKKGLNYPDNHSGMVTHLEPDIQEFEVRWALGSITMNKASGE